MRKEAVYLIFLLLLSNIVLAVGMSPAKLDVNFEPFMKKSFTFYVHHNQNYATNLTFYVAGELNKYVKLDKNSVLMDGPGEAQLTVSLILPSSLEKPGENVLRIGVRDNPLIVPEDVFLATAGVEAILTVNIPYPGKYAEARLETSNIEINEVENFKIYVKNLGREIIRVISGEVVVTDESENEVARIPVTYRGGIESGDEAFIQSRFDTKGLKIGSYNVAAILDYDGKKLTAENQFRIGDLVVELTNWTSVIKKGGIYPIDLWIMNLWGKPVENVYAEVILSRNGEIVSLLRSPSTNIKAFENQRLNVYWDTRTKDGIYDMEVVLKYAGKINTKTVSIEVRGTEINFNLILLVLIIILLAANVIWLTKRKRKK